MRIFIADSDGGYRQPSRVLGGFVEALTARTGAGSAVRVQWPAPGEVGRRRSHTWESASAAGVADLSRLVRLHPSDRMVLIGVCSGSRVIYDWMDEHPESLDRIAAVGMVGDPFRPRDRWIEGTPDPGGQGVAGKRLGAAPGRTFWASVPGDPLSGVEPDSLLRMAVRGSDLAPDQVYDELLEDLPGSRARMAARLGAVQHPSQWSTGLRRRVDEAKTALQSYESREYALLYESGDGGPSPLDHLVTAIADHTSGREGRARAVPAPSELTGS